MAAKGRRLLLFHGAYVKKPDAQKREREVRKAFVREFRLKGGRRFLVLSERQA